MQKVNELFGKRVIGQRTGDQVATVRDVVLDADMRRIVALVIGDGGRGRHDRVLRWGEVVGAGEFIVVAGAEGLPMLSDDDEVRGLREAAETVTGKRVLSAAGEEVGTVGDIYYDRSGAILGYEIKRGLFGGHPALRIGDVRSVGRDAIIAESASLVSREELALPQETLADEPPLRASAVGAPAPAGRPALDPALGEPELRDTDSHRDL